VGTPALDFPPAYSPAVEKVRVREDRITDDDIERVAEWLTLHHDAEWISPGTPEAQHFARDVLSLVLGVE
jgi:hypothetical protein